MHKGNNNSRKKLLLLVVFLTYIATACTSKPIAISQDDNVIEAAVDNEKNLISLQLRELELDEYKANAKKILHSYFYESYIEKIDKINSIGGIYAPSVKTPIIYNVSKVCTDSKKTSKIVFINAPVDDSTSRLYRMCIFKEEDEQWKLFQLREYYVVMDGPKKDDFKRVTDLFTNYDNKPIEYSAIKIRE